MAENIKNKSNISDATPVMKQFWEAKSSCPDSILLFRMGDFYETFEEDAQIASNVLGITLTKRANGAAASVPLAGFPYHSLDQHLHKLLNAGYKVAICEQVENPKDAKGIVKREIVEIISPGTTIADKYLNHTENNFLFSIYFQKNILAYAVLDYSTGEFYVGECLILQLNNILSKYNVSEIIISKKQSEFLSEYQLNNILITEYDNWIANYQACYEKLVEHFGTKSLKGFGLDKNDFTIIASGSALAYVQNNYFGKVKHITSITKINDNNFMGLDSSTVKNLEIFNSISHNNIKGTLIDVIDNTLTPMGCRLLKQHLARPLSNKNKINYRLNILEEFIANHYHDKRIYEELKQISDITRIISKISTDKSNPRDLINLSNSLKSIKKIKDITKNSKLVNKLLKKSRNAQKICSEINKYIIENPDTNLSKGGYIKDGVSKKLDKLRLISNNAHNWFINYQKEQREVTKIPSLKVGYNKIFGYYIDITKTHITKIPKNYIRKQTLANSERYFTEELKKYEDMILSSSEEIILLENKLFNKVVQYILKYINIIQDNAYVLAQIDIISSHAITAIKNNFNKPVINDKSSNIIIKQSRHPVVEHLLPENEKFITNDLEINNKNKQIGIITGPNMAGKSTFLRQVGLIVILAHIGSYVSAEKAKLPIVDQLFTRVGASDNLAGGESTFLIEMNETANILNNATDQSLILLDEIGRGTSTYDGLSLAWAITEYLHNNKRIKAKTLFATHYHELIDLAEELPHAFNLNVAVEEHEDNIIFLKKIKEGGSSKSYGIHVAKMAGLPSLVLSRANDLLFKFMVKKEQPNNKLKISSKQIEIFDKKDLILKEIKKLNLDNTTPIDAMNLLSYLKDKLK